MSSSSLGRFCHGHDRMSNLRTIGWPTSLHTTAYNVEGSQPPWPGQDIKELTRHN